MPEIGEIVDVDPFAAATPSSSGGGPQIGDVVDHDPFDPANYTNILGEIAEVGRGIPAGAVQAAGTALRGLAANQPTQRYASYLDEIEHGVLYRTREREGRLPITDDTAYTDLLQRIADDPGMLQSQQLWLRHAIEGVRSGNPEALTEARSKLPPDAVQERELWRAGEAVSEFAQENFPAKPGYEDSLGRAVGEGLGSLGAGLVTAVVPGVGSGLSTAFFTAMGSGEAADRAVAAGATDEQIIEAAGLGAGAGATDILPAEMLLGRIPGANVIANAVKRYGGKRTMQALGRISNQAIVESVQEGGQQTLQNLIAQEVYDPEQQLLEGVVENAGIGGIVGGIAGLGREGVYQLSTRRSGSARGDRARAVREVPPPSPADEASPIPTGDIIEGRERIADAEATEAANKYLEVAGLPQIGQPVRVSRGRDVIEGVVSDAWEGDDPGLTVRAVDGTETDLSLAQMQAMGATLTGLPMPAPRADIERKATEIAQDAERVAQEAAQAEAEAAAAQEEQRGAVEADRRREVDQIMADVRRDAERRWERGGEAPPRLNAEQAAEVTRLTRAGVPPGEAVERVTRAGVPPGEALPEPAPTGAPPGDQFVPITPTATGFGPAMPEDTARRPFTPPPEPQTQAGVPPGDPALREPMGPDRRPTIEGAAQWARTQGPQTRAAVEGVAAWARTQGPETRQALDGVAEWAATRGPEGRAALEGIAEWATTTGPGTRPRQTPARRDGSGPSTRPTLEGAAEWARTQGPETRSAVEGIVSWARSQGPETRAAIEGVAEWVRTGGPPARQALEGVAEWATTQGPETRAVVEGVADWAQTQGPETRQVVGGVVEWARTQGPTGRRALQGVAEWARSQGPETRPVLDGIAQWAQTQGPETRQALESVADWARSQGPSGRQALESVAEWARSQGPQTRPPVVGPAGRPEEDTGPTARPRAGERERWFQEAIAEATGSDINEARGLAEAVATATGRDVDQARGLAQDVFEASGRDIDRARALAMAISEATGQDVNQSRALAQSIAEATGRDVDERRALAEDVSRATGRDVDQRRALAQDIAGLTGREFPMARAIAEDVANAAGGDIDQARALARSLYEATGRDFDRTRALAQAVAEASGRDITEDRALAESVASVTGQDITEARALALAVADLTGQDFNARRALAQAVEEASGTDITPRRALAEAVASATGKDIDQARALAQAVAQATGRDVDARRALAQAIAESSGRDIPRERAEALGDDDGRQALSFRALERPPTAVEVAEAAEEAGLPAETAMQVGEQVRDALQAPEGAAPTPDMVSREVQATGLPADFGDRIARLVAERQGMLPEPLPRRERPPAREPRALPEDVRRRMEERDAAPRPEARTIPEREWPEGRQPEGLPEGFAARIAEKVAAAPEARGLPVGFADRIAERVAAIPDVQRIETMELAERIAEMPEVQEIPADVRNRMAARAAVEVRRLPEGFEERQREARERTEDAREVALPERATPPEQTEARTLPADFADRIAERVEAIPDVQRLPEGARSRLAARIEELIEPPDIRLAEDAAALEERVRDIPEVRTLPPAARDRVVAEVREIPAEVVERMEARDAAPRPEARSIPPRSPAGVPPGEAIAAAEEETATEVAATESEALPPALSPEVERAEGEAELSRAAPPPPPLMRSNGEPYKTEKSAALAARTRGIDAEPVEVEGGWGLQEAAMPAEPARTRAGAPPGEPVDPEVREVEAAMLQRDLIRRNDGSPFKTRQGAVLAARNKKIEAEPIEIEGGWALQRVEDAMPAAPSPTPPAEALVPEDADQEGAPDEVVVLEGQEAMFQRTPGPPLRATHSIDAERLVSALQRGTLIAPSIAIQPAEVSHRWKTESIDLVFKAGAIDPKRDKIAAGDDWTPVSPETRLRVKKWEDRKAAEDRWREATDEDAPALLDEKGLVEDTILRETAARLGRTPDALAREVVPDAEPVFRDGYDRNGNARFSLATPERIIARMRRDTRENEKIGRHGATLWNTAELVARNRKPMRSTKAVREAAARRIMNRPADQALGDLDQITTRVVRMATDTGVSPSTLLTAVNDAKLNARTAAKEISEYSQHGPVTVEEVQGLVDAVRAAIDSPVRYFETKPLREIPLSDVAAAVVPPNFPAEQREALEAQGIEVREKREDMTDEELAEVQSIPSALFKRAARGTPAEQEVDEITSELQRRQGAVQAPAPARVRIRLNRRYDEAREGVRGDLERIGRETFGQQFRFEIAESITAPEGGQVPGAFDPVNRVAYIALRADKAGMTGSLYHEGLHYLRNAGAFDKADGTPNAAWQTLERQAAQWRQDYGIDERYAGDVGSMDPAARERLLNEEAIAEALADYATRGQETGFGPTVRMALNRILRFFRALREGLSGRGFQTWEDVFEADIGRGRAGERADATQAPSRAELDRQLQTAWHGSPHRFDQFSTERIGSGEGAQVFGWGLYFSDKRGVAEYYRDSVGQSDTLAGLSEAENAAIEPWVRSSLAAIGRADMRTPEERRRRADSVLREMRDQKRDFDQRRGSSKFPWWADTREEYEAMHGAGIAAVEKLQESDNFAVSEKPLYKVDLAPKDSEYLYWDRRLDLQPKPVREALSNLAANVERPSSSGFPFSGGGLAEFERLKTSGFARDEDGAGIYRQLSRLYGSDRAASEALLEAGVRGVKYLDQDSRPMVGALGRARMPLRETFNYVIFDDSDVAIQEIMLQRQREGQGDLAPADDPRQQTLFQRGAKDDPKAFDKAATDWSGVDLTGAAEEVVKDKDRMGGFAEEVKAGLKGTTAIQDPAVTVQEEKTHKDLNLAWRFLAPPLAWSKKYPAIHSLIKQGVETEKSMSNRIQRLNRDWDRVTKPLSKDEFAQLTGIMFLGDAEQTTFTDEQLGRFDTTEKVRTAYRESRKFLDKLGRFTEQHERAMALPLLTRRTTLVRQMAGERGMDKAEFRALYNARAELLAKQRRGEGHPQALEFEIAEATEALFGGQEAPTDLFEDRLKETDRLETRIADTKVRRREGYVPHKFFGRWRIFQAAQPDDEIEPYMGRGGTGFKDRKAAEKVAEASEGGILEGATPVQVDGKWGLEPKWKEVAGEHGLWKTRTDAVRAASHMAREGPDGAEIRVVPVEFEFPHDSATTLGDAAYFTFRSKVEELTGLSGEALQEFVSGVARRPFRRRIAGFLQYRTGMTGYSLDLDRVMRTHVGETVRYVSLDRLKFDAINTMEKEGLSAYRSSIQDRPVLAAAVQAWFRDVNGQKQTLESQVDNVLNKSWVTPLRAGLAAGALGFLAAGGPFNAPISPIVGAYVGYRVGRGLAQGGDFKTRAITGAMLGDMAHLKLGAVFNLMSALVNTSQVPLNTLPVLGVRDTTEGMIRYQKAVLSKLRGKPNADWRFLERMDINPLDTFAEGTRHKFQKEPMLSKVSMVFFTTAEGFNRGVTSLGALNKAQRKGWSHGKAKTFANETLDRTQFHYGASDKPELLRNVLLRVPLQFKNFVAHQLAFVFGLNRKELPLFLLSMALTAGALGIPGLDFVDTLTDWLFDFSPIAMMKEAALDAAVEGELEGGIATFLTRGVPGLAGVDMTGRVGMGDKFLPMQFRDWTGPWISTVQNAVRHGREGAHWTHQMRNLSPGLGNPLVVLDAWENGGQVRSPWKRNRPEYQATETELIQKLAGARPIREARLQDLRDVERRDIERYRTDTRRYVDRIVAALDRGDREAARAVMQEALDAGIPISSGTIRRGIQDFGTQRALREFDRLPRTMKPEGMGRREAIERMAQ